MIKQISTRPDERCAAGITDEFVTFFIRISNFLTLASFGFTVRTSGLARLSPGREKERERERERERTKREHADHEPKQHFECKSIDKEHPKKSQISRSRFQAFSVAIGGSLAKALCH